MATCFLVLGTPRSGTSCVAGVLHHLGIVMGRALPSEDGSPRFDWPGGDIWNATGYYQDAPLENLESAIFDDGFRGRLIERLQPDHETELAAIIKERESLGVAWGSKTSRMAYLLPHFLRLVTSDVRLICTDRKYSESVASWDAMIGQEAGDPSVLIADAKAAVSQVATLGLPTLNVRFDDLMANNGIVESIADFCGVPVAKEALSHIDSGLRRFQHSGRTLG